MSQIKVTITKGNTEVSSKATVISSNTLQDLISSIKTAKSETNEILSELVDQQKSSLKSARVEVSEDDEEESEEENDEKSSKKLKI